MSQDKLNIFTEAKSFALSALEELCNRALQYDESSRLALAKLSGHELKVECALPLSNESLKFYINFSEQGLIFCAYSELESDASIFSDNLRTLSSFFSGKRISVNQREKLIIQGNLELVDQLQDILSQVEIDWEEPLSRLVGDVAAHEIHRMVDDAGELLKKANDFIENDLIDGLNRLSERFFKARGNGFERQSSFKAKKMHKIKTFDDEIAEIETLQENAEQSLNKLEQHQRP